MNRQLFRTIGSGSQLSFLALFFFSGLILTGIVSALYLALSGQHDIYSLSPNILKFIQTIQAVFVFLVPAWLCAYLFHESPKQYLTIHSRFSIGQVLIVSGIMISLLPFINWVGYFNSQMVLPETLSGLEAQIKEAEMNAGKLTERLLLSNSIIDFISSLAVIAFVAAITEEFFFRGVLQQILAKSTRNIHLAVWITAIVFSAIHFQFYGFLPRMLLGAVMGYVFVWTGSIWMAVLAHFVNNACAVISHYLYAGTSTYDRFEKLGTNGTWPFALAGFLTALLLIVLLRRTTRGFQSRQ
ncbi:MAG: peptidase [Bacteroidetes bacterium]|jgi:uncharacterized protein|nr:peptidase [Bacteroidota bacterium]